MIPALDMKQPHVLLIQLTRLPYLFNIYATLHVADEKTKSNILGLSCAPYQSQNER